MISQLVVHILTTRLLMVQYQPDQWWSSDNGNYYICMYSIFAFHLRLWRGGGDGWRRKLHMNHLHVNMHVQTNKCVYMYWSHIAIDRRLASISKIIIFWCFNSGGSGLLLFPRQNSWWKHFPISKLLNFVLVNCHRQHFIWRAYISWLTSHKWNQGIRLELSAFI